MRLISILILLCMTTMAGIVCAEPVAQTAAVAPAVETTTPDPAGLLRNGAAPLAGILTGGQPTESQFETLAELGYTTVVNLRDPDEQGNTDPAAVEALGMTYVSIPVAEATDVNEEKARRLGEVLEAADGPVVLHCASGNRVGALLALKAYYVDGSSPDDALALGMDAGLTRLEPVVRQQLGLE